MATVAVKQTPDYQRVDGFFLPGAFSPQAFRDTVKFKVQPGDLFVSTYPKCGTTWTQQIMYLLRHDGQPPKDGLDFLLDSPFLEMTGTDGLDKVPPPRAFKVHLPFNLTPYSSEGKYIAVFRNPKDCLVSFYHHTHSPFYNFENGDFNDYFEFFMKGEVDSGDYFEHVLSWYAHKDDPNVLFLIYEEMKKDPKASIIKLAEFMGEDYRKLIEDDGKMEKVLEYSSFEYMKKTTNDDMEKTFATVFTSGVDIDSLPITPAMKHIFKYQKNKNVKNTKKMEHVRKGIVGDWRNNFTEDQNRRMNEKIEAKLAGTSLLAYWKSIDCL